MAKWFWGFLLILLLGSGNIGIYPVENVPEEKEAVWNYSGSENPAELIYTQNYEMQAVYETKDRELIRQCISALKEMQIEAETDLCVTDCDDILHFVMEDGGSYSVSFEGRNLFRDGKRYTVTGGERLWAVLKKLVTDAS